MVVLVAPQGTAPGWVLQASSPQRLKLIPVAPEPVPAQRSLQFWTKADSWSALVSPGLVEPGKPIEIPLDKLPPHRAQPAVRDHGRALQRFPHREADRADPVHRAVGSAVSRALRHRHGMRGMPLEDLGHA